MIEVLVRENDRVEFARFAGWNRGERANECAGARVDVNLRYLFGRVAEREPHPARGADLPCDDETRAACPEKANRNHVCGTADVSPGTLSAGKLAPAQVVVR